MAAFRVFLIVLALTAPVWALHATNVSACTCGIQLLEDSVAQAEFIVLGTVERVEATDPPQEVAQEFDKLPWLVSTVLVEEYLKGSGPATVQHTFLGNFAGCQSGNREGNRYLLAYVRRSDGTLGTSFCSGSLDLTGASGEAAAQHVQDVRELLENPVVGFPDTGTGTGDPGDSSLGWQVTAAAGVALAVSASAALVALRRRPY